MTLSYSNVQISRITLYTAVCVCVNIFLILFLSFRRVVNVIYSFLGNSPASEI